MKLVKAFLLMPLLTLSLTAVDIVNALQIPVVPNGTLGTFRHGTYPSKGDTTHAGVDILAPCGSNIYAFADGLVSDLIDDPRDKDFDLLGYMVMLVHQRYALTDEVSYTVYLHMQAPPQVKYGEPVDGGKTVIGKIGKTGAADTCQTHFEIRHFASRFSEWGKIYGAGDQRNAEYFKTSWEDPLIWFEKAPGGKMGAQAAPAAHEQQTAPGAIAKSLSAQGSLAATSPEGLLIEWAGLKEGLVKEFQITDTQVGTESHPATRRITFQVLSRTKINGEEVVPFLVQSERRSIRILYYAVDGRGIRLYGERELSQKNEMKLRWSSPVFPVKVPMGDLQRS